MENKILIMETEPELRKAYNNKVAECIGLKDKIHRLQKEVRGNNMKTLEDFVIKEIEDLRKENKILRKQIEAWKKQSDHYEYQFELTKGKLDCFIRNVKRDFDIKIAKSISESEYISCNNNWIWKDSRPEEFEFYKKIFNLEEKKENTNE